MDWHWVHVTWHYSLEALSDSFSVFLAFKAPRLITPVNLYRCLSLVMNDLFSFSQTHLALMSLLLFSVSVWWDWRAVNHTRFQRQVLDSTNTLTVTTVHIENNQYEYCTARKNKLTLVVLFMGVLCCRHNVTVERFVAWGESRFSNSWHILCNVSKSWEYVYVRNEGYAACRLLAIRPSQDERSGRNIVYFKYNPVIQLKTM